MLLTLLTSLAWSVSYLLAIIYSSNASEFIVILVFGGMCVGAIASLSMWLSAYITYILPMFLPVITYNLSFFNIHRTVWASLFFLFVVMIIVTAKLNNTLLDKTFKLAKEKERLIKKLKILSITDILTGLYNRRYFEELIEREINRGKRNKYSLNLISIDVDNFKLINDNFGHPYGDKFLQYIAEILNKSFTRANDFVFRSGGDEFAALLINISVEKALERCKIIQQYLQDKNQFPDYLLLNNASIFEQISVSVGLVNVPYTSSSSIDQIVCAVDKALYQSKQQGKNKIVLTTI